MKKRTTHNIISSRSLGAVAALCLPFLASAQVPTPAFAARPESQAAAGPVQLFRRALNLSDEQVKNLQPAFREHQVKVAALRADNSLTRQEKVAKMKQIRDSLDAKMKPILTAEQQAKWEKMRPALTASAPEHGAALAPSTQQRPVHQSQGQQ